MREHHARTEVHLSHLPAFVDEGELRSDLQTFGTVTKIHISKDPAKRSGSATFRYTGKESHLLASINRL
jgi:hypothetical protein